MNFSCTHAAINLHSFLFCNKNNKMGNVWLDTLTLLFNFRETSEDIEDRLRRAIRDVVSCNLFKSHPFGFLEQLLPADCIISSLTLEAVAADRDTYKKLIGKLGTYIKKGGGLFLVGALNQLFFTIGNKKFYCLELDADFVKNAVESAGFKDIEMDVKVIDTMDDMQKDYVVKDYFMLSATKI